MLSPYKSHVTTRDDAYVTFQSNTDDHIGTLSVCLVQLHVMLNDPLLSTLIFKILDLFVCMSGMGKRRNKRSQEK